MNEQELNISNALLSAKEVIILMLKNGFGKVEYTFALSNMLTVKYNLTSNESLVVIEEALNIL